MITEVCQLEILRRRNQRSINGLRSELLDIPGVGAKTAKKLLTELGSAKAVRAATEAEIAAVTGPSVAARIRAHYDAGPTETAEGTYSPSGCVRGVLRSATPRRREDDAQRPVDAG